MNEPIDSRLRDVICGELGLRGVSLFTETLATEVPGWDSLAHTRVIVAVEEAYGIRIKGIEAIRLRNVGDLQRLVQKKTAESEP